MHPVYAPRNEVSNTQPLPRLATFDEVKIDPASNALIAVGKSFELIFYKSLGKWKASIQENNRTIPIKQQNLPRECKDAQSLEQLRQLLTIMKGALTHLTDKNRTPAVRLVGGLPGGNPLTTALNKF